jgi:hypothetical protein
MIAVLFNQHIDASQCPCGMALKEQQALPFYL